ncbi:MAG: hypothetical protein KIG91_03140 [Treponema sp.]|nr:hypothetical protein [Treponema sp.]
MGKKIVSCIATFLLAGFCFAGQISIQIVQHNGALDYVSEQSLLVEDELMNGFFAKGFIVTNSLAQVSDSDETDADLFHTGFGEAFDGSSDYFVQVKLFYDSSTNKGVQDATQCRLDHIDWVMLNVSSGETLKTSSIKGSEKSPGSDENIRLSAASLIKDIQKAL